MTDDLLDEATRLANSFLPETQISKALHSLVERVRQAEAESRRLGIGPLRQAEADRNEAQAKLDTVRALALSTRSGENDHRYWVQAWDQHALPVGDVLAILDGKGGH